MTTYDTNGNDERRGVAQRVRSGILVTTGDQIRDEHAAAESNDGRSGRAPWIR